MSEVGKREWRRQTIRLKKHTGQHHGSLQSFRRSLCIPQPCTMNEDMGTQRVVEIGEEGEEGEKEREKE